MFSKFDGIIPSRKFAGRYCWNRSETREVFDALAVLCDSSSSRDGIPMCRIEQLFGAEYVTFIKSVGIRGTHWARQGSGNGGNIPIIDMEYVTLEGFYFMSARYNMEYALELEQDFSTKTERMNKKKANNTIKFPSIEAERVKSGMTVGDLAAAIGVSLDTLTNWQNGKNEIPASKIVALAVLFNVTTDYLLGRTNFNAHDVVHNK